MPLDFSSVTEVPGIGMTRHALEMATTRYTQALPYCEGGSVLEVACGAGQGLGLLAGRARRVVGGDVTFDLVRSAGRHYRGRVDAVCLDALNLPFRDGAFEAVILYEAIYYLPDAARFIAECKRVLTSGGTLIICSINPEWAGFNPSPFSTRYFSATQLGELLLSQGFSAELFGAHPEGETSSFARAIGLIRQTAVHLHLMPRTMRGKELLKRLFYGKLTAAPQELQPRPAPGAPLTPLHRDQPAALYRVVFAIGRLPDGG